ncbi:hypothetical protein C8R47DRAFT_1316728 [Mycena vitilis]|nr:hypothetical protein C8R47DRAFT_1316728 [Mycena vitilis]
MDALLVYRGRSKLRPRRAPDVAARSADLLHVWALLQRLSSSIPTQEGRALCQCASIGIPGALCHPAPFAPAVHRIDMALLPPQTPARSALPHSCACTRLERVGGFDDASSNIWESASTYAWADVHFAPAAVRTTSALPPAGWRTPPVYYQTRDAGRGIQEAVATIPLLFWRQSMAGPATALPSPRLYPFQLPTFRTHLPSTHHRRYAHTLEPSALPLPSTSRSWRLKAKARGWWGRGKEGRMSCWTMRRRRTRREDGEISRPHTSLPSPPGPLFLRPTTYDLLPASPMLLSIRVKSGARMVRDTGVWTLDVDGYRERSRPKIAVPSGFCLLSTDGRALPHSRFARAVFPPWGCHTPLCSVQLHGHGVRSEATVAMSLSAGTVSTTAVARAHRPDFALSTIPRLTGEGRLHSLPTTAAADEEVIHGHSTRLFSLSGGRAVARIRLTSPPQPAADIYRNVPRA